MQSPYSSYPQDCKPQLTTNMVTVFNVLNESSKSNDDVSQCSIVVNLANEMVYYIQTKGKQIEKQGMKDNLYMAMENWLTLGMQAGFRISEWAQYRTRLNQANDFARSCDGSSTTFRTEDILSFLSGKKMINIKQSLLKLKHVKLVNLCWRFQKD